MRLWSLHPRYLDAKGLVALWREGLLAQKVLAGETVGYRHHPQLLRFRARRDALGAIGAYLAAVQAEAERRGYAFNAGKIRRVSRRVKLTVTRGQVDYELEHLRAKLKVRDAAAYTCIAQLKRPVAYSLFRVEAWEKTCSPSVLLFTSKGCTKSTLAAAARKLAGRSVGAGGYPTALSPPCREQRGKPGW